MLTPALPLLARAALCRYFQSRKSLPRQYWTGIERNGSFSLYAFPDLSYVSQTASNDPYAHWWVVAWRRLAVACQWRLAACMQYLGFATSCRLTVPCAHLPVCCCRGWSHPSARKVADSNCVLASSVLAYDLYLGDTTTAQLANASYYLRDSFDLKYGWAGASCLTLAAAICEVAASSYPCPSPPSPPVAPEMPAPMPPEVPDVPYCEWLGCSAG